MAKVTKKRKAGRVVAKREVRVWHLFRFEQRFELPEDMRKFRKSPLAFTKDFVGSGQDDEAISFQQQMGIVDGLDEHLLLRGAFSVLKNLAANRSRCYRGYLLDERLLPASERRISQWLRLDLPATKKVLKTLAKVGLIEKVPLPPFDPAVNDETKPAGPDDDEPKPGKKKPAGKGKTKTKAKAKTKTKTKTAKSSPKTGKKGDLRNAPEISGDGRKPLRGKTKTKTKTNTKFKSEIGNGKDKDKNKRNPDSAAPHPGSRAGSTEPAETTTPTAKANPTGKPDEGQYQPPRLKLHVNTEPEEKQNTNPPGQGQEQQEPHRQTPTATPPNPKYPTESDTGCGGQNTIAEQNTTTESDAGEGLSAVSITGSNGSLPRSANGLTDRLDKLYDPQARDFATEIYRAMQTPYVPGSEECRCELANFAAAWSKAQAAGLSPAELAGLWDKSVREAEKMKAKRRRVKFRKSPEAVWRYLFNKRLAAWAANTETKSHVI